MYLIFKRCSPIFSIVLPSLVVPTPCSRGGQCDVVATWQTPRMLLATFFQQCDPPCISHTSSRHSVEDRKSNCKESGVHNSSDKGYPRRCRCAPNWSPRLDHPRWENQTQPMATWSWLVLQCKKHCCLWRIGQMLSWTYMFRVWPCVPQMLQCSNIFFPVQTLLGPRTRQCIPSVRCCRLQHILGKCVLMSLLFGQWNSWGKEEPWTGCFPNQRSQVSSTDTCAVGLRELGPRCQCCLLLCLPCGVWVGWVDGVWSLDGWMVFWRMICMTSERSWQPVRFLLQKFLKT